MEQKEFLKRLFKSYEEMQNNMYRVQIINMNGGEGDPEIINKSSGEFRKFKNDVDAYFSLFPSIEHQEADRLLNRAKLDTMWLDDIGVFLHSLDTKLLSQLPIPTKNDKKLKSNSVFIVHGHDNEAKFETARVIEKLGLEAIILHEQASVGDTIIEKIEHNSDVGFAVVLYTPCDKGHSVGETTTKNRARQNVVFEHGYLIGKLGRKRVCALVKGDVETPSDISGVVYIAMDNGSAWKYALIDEMNAVGFQLDKNVIRP
jgi:predicted nucleotide-binding protein